MEREQEFAPLYDHERFNIARFADGKALMVLMALLASDHWLGNQVCPISARARHRRSKSDVPMAQRIDDVKALGVC
jgi:hypothetical protein